MGIVPGRGYIGLSSERVTIYVGPRAPPVTPYAKPIAQKGRFFPLPQLENWHVVPSLLHPPLVLPLSTIHHGPYSIQVYSGIH